MPAMERVMPHSTKTRWSGWLKPIGFAHRDDGSGKRRRGSDDDGGASHSAAAPAASQAQEAGERLERIAMYARAGYFNMGYTLDMMQAPGEILPD
ncbi:hypothetical protein BTO02_30275 [Paraburkholderia sp. SOS3]|jgi:hypothetical protein|nr:hypothetical protein BTO02_30275 [Paraburkholderia sp. SOS3]